MSDMKLKSVKIISPLNFKFNRTIKVSMVGPLIHFLIIYEIQNITQDSRATPAIATFLSISVNQNLQKLRSSPQRCTVRKGVLRNFSKFTRK